MTWKHLELVDLLDLRAEGFLSKLVHIHKEHQKMADLLRVYSGYSNLPRIHLTYFNQSLEDTRKVQYQAGNSILEKNLPQ